MLTVLFRFWWNNHSVLNSINSLCFAFTIACLSEEINQFGHILRAIIIDSSQAISLNSFSILVVVRLWWRNELFVILLSGRACLSIFMTIHIDSFQLLLDVALSVKAWFPGISVWWRWWDKVIIASWCERKS